MPRPEEIAPNPKRPARFYPCRACFAVLNSENHSFSMAESSISRRTPGFPCPSAGAACTAPPRKPSNIGLAALVLRHRLGVVQPAPGGPRSYPARPVSLICRRPLGIHHLGRRWRPSHMITSTTVFAGSVGDAAPDSIRAIISASFSLSGL